MEAEHSSYHGSENNNIENINNYMNNNSFIKIKHKNTDDPTYINKKYMHKINDIYIYQKG